MNLLIKLTSLISKPRMQLTVFTALVGLMSAQAFAQYNNNDRRYDRADYIVVYEHCDFRGDRREVPVGEHRSLRGLGIDNDSISSVEVPRGLALVMFEDDNFRGEYARVNRDISCLDRGWNDKVSSMDVVYDRSSQHNNSRYDDRYSSDRYEERRNNNTYNDRYDNRDYQSEGPNPRGYNDRRGQNIPRYGNQVRNDSGVTAKNIASVSYAGIALTKTDSNRWRSSRNRVRANEYRETSRGDNAVFLENTRTSEKIKIDLFTNQVVVIARDGRQNRFPISAKQAGAVRTVGPEIATRNNQPSGSIRNRCFNYKAYTLGGNGGIRFHGHEGFHQFGKKGHSDRICHDGALTAEINKTDPNTRVVLEIEGKKFIFAANEKEDVYKNNWYRKLVRLSVGR